MKPNHGKKEHQESSGKYDFVGKVNLFGGLSLLFTVVAFLYLSIHGLNYGIDFAGGTEMQVKFTGTVNIDQVRSMVEKQNLMGVSIQGFGDQKEFLIRFQTKHGNNEKETNEIQNASVKKLKEDIMKDFGPQTPEFRRIDSVGPQVGAELKRNSFLAVFYCLLVILIYVALRFDYKYAPGAVVCLFHDAIITLGIFVAVGKEVNVPVLAAILTLIGYSLNDTIVVFDRIRETEGAFKRLGIRFIINRAINDMFGRTIITSGTVFTSAAALFIFADGTVSDISLAICVGILFGTYSSIYVAAPLIILMEKLNLIQSAELAKA